MDTEQTAPERAHAEAPNTLDAKYGDSSASAEADKTKEFSESEVEEERDQDHQFMWQRRKYDYRQSPYGNFRRQFIPFNRTLAEHEI